MQSRESVCAHTGMHARVRTHTPHTKSTGSTAGAYQEHPLLTPCGRTRGGGGGGGPSLLPPSNSASPEDLRVPFPSTLSPNFSSFCPHPVSAPGFYLSALSNPNRNDLTVQVESQDFMLPLCYHIDL